MIEVLSPVGVPAGDLGRLAPGIATIGGATFGLFSNNKNGTEAILRGLERGLAGSGVTNFYRTSKPIASMAYGDIPGAAEICDVAVVALAD